MSSTLEAVKPSFCVIGIDRTNVYNIKDSHKQHVEKIYDVYLFDKARQVHLCEMASSNELHYLYSTVWLRDYDIDEDLKDEIYELYEYIANVDTQRVIYYHVYDIENMVESAIFHYVKNHKPTVEREEYSSDDEYYDAMVEELKEYYNCNRVV